MISSKLKVILRITANSDFFKVSRERKNVSNFSGFWPESIYVSA
jgi:hypothetical protein